jgi:predicted DNA-binding transcriptional regulator
LKKQQAEMTSDFANPNIHETGFDAATCGEDEIIHRLGRVYRKQVRNGERLIMRRFSMRMTEFIILQMLTEAGPLRLRRIAAERFLLGEDVFLAAGTLLERGFIRFAKYGDHYGLAEVTLLGRRLVERLAPRILARQTRLTETMAKPNRTRLLNVLAALEAALDQEAKTQEATALEIDQLAELIDADFAGNSDDIAA